MLIAGAVPFPHGSGSRGFDLDATGFRMAQDLVLFGLVSGRCYRGGGVGTGRSQAPAAGRVSSMKPAGGRPGRSSPGGAGGIWMSSANARVDAFSGEKRPQSQALPFAGTQWCTPFSSTQHRDVQQEPFSQPTGMARGFVLRRMGRPRAARARGSPTQERE